ncbi:MAG: hypothetical protein WA885_10855 [Phormidesmis sp.]
MVLGNVLNSPARRRRHRRANGLLFSIRQGITALIAFIAATLLLGQMMPGAPIPSNVVFIGPKYDYYQAHKDDYNALFFGSSRVYSHIIPAVFDEVAQANNVAVNSYNFGIPAMRSIDSTVLLETVLANPPKNLKWVFFESILDKGYEPFPNARTHRAMYWHNWKNTAFAARYILSSDESLPQKAVLLSSHLLPFLYHQMNVGRWVEQISPSEFSAGEKEVVAEFTASEGYYALTDESDPRRQDFLHNLADYQAQVANLSEFQSGSALAEPYLSDNKAMLLRRVSKVVQSVGAEPIFIEPPSLHFPDDFAAARQLGTIAHLLSYKDPARFPQLYQVDRRYDADHLNESGSREFTRLLSEDFSAIAQSNPSK